MYYGYNNFLIWPVLRLFTVVRFQNVPCIGPNGENGTCYHGKECSDMGGHGTSSCAQGLGVCCLCEISFKYNFMHTTSLLLLNMTNLCQLYSLQDLWRNSYSKWNIFCEYWSHVYAWSFHLQHQYTKIEPVHSTTPARLPFICRKCKISFTYIFSFTPMRAKKVTCFVTSSIFLFQMLPPNAGNCEADRFLVSGQNTNNIVPILCGNNSGTHCTFLLIENY